MAQTLVSTIGGVPGTTVITSVTGGTTTVSNPTALIFTGASVSASGTAALVAVTGGTGGGAGTVTSLTAGSGITLTPSTITSAGAIAITNTSVTPGSYTNMNATVNASGQITAASNGTGGGGSFVLLETHTASGSASLPFTTGITSAYDDYDIEINNLVLGTSGSDINIQFSTDGGSTWVSGSSYYSAVILIHNDASTTIQTVAGGAAMSLLKGQITDNSLPFSATIKMTDPLSTAATKGLLGTIYGNITGAIVNGSWSGTLLIAGTAYNAFQIIASSGTLASGSARLYGRSKS